MPDDLFMPSSTAKVNQIIFSGSKFTKLPFFPPILHFLSNHQLPITFELEYIDEIFQLTKVTLTCIAVQCSDITVAVRRKTTFERLKRRAELDGKSVCVTDGQLIINGTAEYSLSQGSLRSHYSASING
jgi:hypothetical protein